MPKKNYDKMYKSDIPAEETAPVEEPVVEEAEAPKKTTKKAKVPFMGKVTGGLNLNVRKSPNGQIVASLADGAQVRVINDEDPDWYQIESPIGFVMKKFVEKV